MRATLVARRSGTGVAAPGTPVPAAELGVRTFLDSRRGFALTMGLSLDAVTYPAATIDGGRLYAFTGEGRAWASRDGGRTWRLARMLP